MYRFVREFDYGHTGAFTVIMFVTMTISGVIGFAGNVIAPAAAQSDFRFVHSGGGVSLKQLGASRCAGGAKSKTHPLAGIADHCRVYLYWHANRYLQSAVSTGNSAEAAAGAVYFGSFGTALPGAVDPAR